MPSVLRSIDIISITVFRQVAGIEAWIVEEKKKKNREREAIILMPPIGWDEKLKDSLAIEGYV